MAFAALGEGDKAAELLGMLNPIGRAGTARRPFGALRRRALRRRGGRLRAETPHVGRGGWTWITGVRGLDVSRRSRVAAGVSGPRRPAC